MLHEHDGGRYIGTDDLVIMRDPEQGWVNCGTYRSMVQGPDRVGLWISPGKHGRQIREKYWSEGKPCPVLISCGHDPLLFLAGGNEIRFGLSEYDYAAGHRGAPYDVIESELYRLPMPAHAEIVLEGAMHPGETTPEGPFGEFTGYYAGGRSEQPVVRVERIYHRNDPILGIACPMVPPSDFSYSKCVMKAGMIWDEVERAGLSGVRGVWVHEAGCARMFNVISIKQAYAGHAKQAAHARRELPVRLLPRALRGGGRRRRRPGEPRSRCSGRCARAAIPPRTSISSAATGAGRSTRACRAA